MPALLEPTDRIEGDNFKPATFLPQIGYLICWGCETGFRPHEYAALKAAAEKVH